MSCRWVEASRHDILSIKNSSFILSPDWKLGFGDIKWIGTSVDLWVSTLCEYENVIVQKKFHVFTRNERKANGETVFSLLLKAGQSQYEPAEFGTLAAQTLFDGTTAVSCFVKINNK